MTKQIDWEKVIESLKKDIMYYENLSFKQPRIDSWFDRNAILGRVLEAIQKGLKPFENKEEPMKEIEGEERKERIKNIKCESCRLFFQHHHDISNNLSAEFDNSDILNCKICKNYQKHECKKIEEPMTEEEEDKYWGELALEANKEPSIGVENTMKFLTRNKKTKIDFTKPIECVNDDGESFKARIFSTEINDRDGNDLTVLIGVTNAENIEQPYLCNKLNGNMTECNHPYIIDGLKIQNVPEKPPLDLHVGGVYKCQNGKIGIVQEITYEKDPWCKDGEPPYIFLVNIFNGINWYYNKNGKSLTDNLNLDFTEKLGDIRDLHADIKVALK